MLHEHLENEHVDLLPTSLPLKGSCVAELVVMEENNFQGKRLGVGAMSGRAAVGYDLIRTPWMK